MFGQQSGTVRGVQLVDIHGTRFCDVTYELDSAPGQLKAGRIGLESVYETPAAGDRVLLHLLLGVLTKVEKAP